MNQTFTAVEIQIGYHPDGFRIDKTAQPLNRYTKWTVTDQNQWNNPAPVCFDSLPADGWIKADRFDWDSTEPTKE
ncbi:MAG: hypothetical protein JW936_02725 [Sedimentisphaerales bacterium]|nr:hypothetical protein [Sedimentisphaerales bacterium]